MRKLIAFFLLAVAVALLAVGVVRKRKVYDADAGEFGIMTYHRLRDWQLVIEATFTGVERRNNKLYSTYDRNGPRGKRACPT